MLVAIVSSIIGGLTVAAIVALGQSLVKRTWPWKRTWNIRVLLFVIAILSALVFASDFTPVRIAETIRAAIFPGSLPQNEQWTTLGWQSFNEAKYTEAIEAATKVVDKFGGRALRDQAELENSGEPRPPYRRVGPRASVEILDRGVLNDVAASYWILGRSYEELENDCKAREAYEQTAALTYARIIDPRWWPLRGWSPAGWFWIPSEEAEDRLSKVRCNEREPAAAESDSMGQRETGTR